MAWLSVAAFIVAGTLGALSIAAKGRVALTILGALTFLMVTFGGGVGILFAGAPSHSFLPQHAVQGIIAASALWAAVLGGGAVVRMVLEWANGGQPDPDRLPGSAWIGVAERFAFTLALIIGATEIAAVVLAAKALGVYATRKDNVTAAVRVLGTLVSIGWALYCFVVAVLVGFRLA
ncbi:MAG: hypothetical protein WBL06_13525 [Pseudolysinimonas sp.]|jgi:hypothetical protein|uniref:hypothetical protein n=1 Tax=Pseudolysinimonas sp. TaxID=2680009 RepID=UPI003C73E9DC